MRAECLAGERPAGETGNLSIDVGNRTHIRGQYALTQNSLEMMASGYCEPQDNANGEAAKRLFDYGGTTDANGNPPYESAVEAAYEAGPFSPPFLHARLERDGREADWKVVPPKCLLRIVRVIQNLQSAARG